MKKTLLISTAFFLSAASFAQTSATNSDAVKGQTNIEHNKAGTQVNSSENASSATTIHSGIVENAKSGATDQIKKDNQAMAAQKQALAAGAKTKGQETANTASQGRSAAASANSKARIDVSSSQDNNPDENSSINVGGNVSASTDKNQVGKLKSAEKQNFHATLKGDNRSQIAVDKTAAKMDHKINASSAAKVHTAAATAHSVRVRPVPVKAATHVRTAGAIRIR